MNPNGESKLGSFKRRLSGKASDLFAAGKGPAALTTKTTVLVTGGNGFLGRHIIEHLLADGRFAIRVFDIREPSEPISGIEYFVGDLRNPEHVLAACQGAEAVFHTATAAPTGANAYNKELMHSVNVVGTATLLSASNAAGVTRFIHTSSASVVFNGNDLLNVDETAPYAPTSLDYYSQTKIEAEKLVLQANGQRGMATCALRPSGIFGEYDTLLVPTTVNNAKAGKLKYIIGKGKNLMDWTYAGNVADAHINAYDALGKGGASSVAAGQAYFITNDDPRPFWGFMGDLCSGLGYPRPRIHLPFYLILFLAYFLQYFIAPLLGPFKRVQTDFTPFRVRLSAANRAFNCSKAKEQLGYKPKVSVEEGLSRTVVFFSDLRNPKALATKGE